MRAFLHKKKYLKPISADKCQKSSVFLLLCPYFAKKESGRLVVDNCKKLREHLEKFADIATEILPLKYGEKVKFWNG